MERTDQMQATLRYALQTQVGLRPNNEDAAFAGPRLLALADGVGGHAAGEIASSLVIEHLKPLNDRLHRNDLFGDLRSAVAGANASLAEHAARRPDVAGMATTLTAIYFAGNRLGLAHIGDSRALPIAQRSAHSDNQRRHIGPIARRRRPSYPRTSKSAPATLDGSQDSLGGGG
jgi:serine/threonine protein phosphatase PrpC